MFNVELMPRASLDVALIKAYLSQFYASTPKKFMKEFQSAVDSLSFSPWNNALPHISQ
jgi:hypothetical protein